MEVFKTWLDVVLGNLLWLPLLGQGSWTRQFPEIPANLNHSVMNPVTTNPVFKPRPKSERLRVNLVVREEIVKAVVLSITGIWFWYNAGSSIMLLFSTAAMCPQQPFFQNIISFSAHHTSVFSSHLKSLNLVRTLNYQIRLSVKPVTLWAI